MGHVGRPLVAEMTPVTAWRRVRACRLALLKKHPGKARLGTGCRRKQNRVAAQNWTFSEEISHHCGPAGPSQTTILVYTVSEHGKEFCLLTLSSARRAKRRMVPDIDLACRASAELTHAARRLARADES